MTNPDIQTYRAGLCERVKQARKGAGYKQEEIAQILGIPRETYAKYELRSPIPHNLLHAFCRATGADLYVLITGRRRGA